MPQKFSPSAGDSMFSSARSVYRKDGGGGALLSGHYDASQHIALKKLNTVGKSSMLQDQQLHFKDKQSKRIHIEIVL